MKPSQIPELPRATRGCDVVLQPLKLPMTLTVLALGAQTAKLVPASPFTLRGWAPNRS